MSSPIAIPTSSSTLSSSMSTSPSTGRYVPVHKRSPSASRTAQSTTYSRDELLALAPSTSWSHPEALSSSPEQFHHLQQHVEPPQGWAQAHEAMRDYLRVACPEIVLNRKMRKSLQYHQHQQYHQQQRGGAIHPRPVSPASSSTSAEEPEHRPVKPAQQQQQQVQVPSRPATPSAFKRVTPRRNRPAARTNNRTARLNGFNAFHKQLSAPATEADWRTVARRPVVTPAI